MSDELPHEVTIRERKNTDLNENRGMRGERQFQFEKKIDQLAGEPIVERLLRIRAELFVDTLTQSEKRIDQLVSDEASTDFPDRKLLATSGVARLIGLVE